MFGSGFKKKRGGDRHEGRPPAVVLRGVGRVALWAAVALLLVRGAGSLLSTPAEEAPARVGGGAGPGKGAEATAVAFARAWLEDPDPRALAPYLAEGAHLGRGTAPSEPGQVAQTEVSAAERLGDGRWALTVSCDLRDARVLTLAVPISVTGAGEAAVLGAPSIVATPAPAGADPESPRPVSGDQAGAVGELVAKFLPAYLSAASSKELSYLVAPGSVVVPTGGAVEVVSVGGVDQLGDGEGPRRELTVTARVREPASGAVYPAAYRLRIEERAGRWYVAVVEGAVG
jgi:hypothetical protein